MSLTIADLFPDLIVLTSPHKHSLDNIPSIIEVTLQATKPRPLVDSDEYFWFHIWLLPSIIYLMFQINSLLSKGSSLWLKFLYSIQNLLRVSRNYFSVDPENKVLIIVFTWIWWWFCACLKTSSLMWIITHSIQPVTA